MFISLDLEHGGENCGITQLSAQLFRLSPNSVKKTTPTQELTYEPDIIIEEIFDKYVKPPMNATWDNRTTEVTGLHKDHPSIKDAQPIEVVWKQFVTFLEKYIEPANRGVLVAWNGNSCDYSWLYKLVQAPGSTLTLPDRVCYSLDPYNVIRKYKSCKFHPSHSKLESLSLGSVYKYATGSDLQNAHSSIVDAKLEKKNEEEVERIRGEQE